MNRARPVPDDATIPACLRCGSQRLRRPHSRNGLERFIRSATRWDRYACPDCGDRGWVRAPVPQGGDPLEAAAHRPASLPAGRPIEVRDTRAQRNALLNAFLTVAVALLLGALAAIFLQRCGAAPPVE